ncbi:MAG: transporter substrate-binding domain-containing protein [Candidatus Krumholzibacteriia bacterium]
MVRSARLLVLLCATVLAAATSAAQDTASPARHLVVGTKPTEPFVIKNADGTWGGISIELWREIAAEQGWTYEFRELPLEELIEAVESGGVDVAVAAFTMTAEREQFVDFSHPFYSTGLGIAIASNRGGGWTRVARRYLSREFLGVVAGLALLLLVVGFVVWAFERRRNPEQFGGNAVRGIGSGFWWSAVTMTTVGYGDKTPATFWGRAVSLVWMFAGIIMISTFTAAITSSLTLTQLQSRVQGPEDLARARVGTLSGSAPEASLDSRGVAHRSIETLETGMEAVSRGEIDAVVYDAPILRYLVKTHFQGEIEVLPRTFERHDYAIVLPSGSRLREPVNRSLLRVVRQPAWRDLLARFMGE